LIMMPVPMIQVESRRLLGILILPLAVYRHVRSCVDPPVGDGRIEDEEIFRPRPFDITLERNEAGRLIDILMRGPDGPESLIDMLIRGFRILRQRLQRAQAMREAEPDVYMDQDEDEEEDTDDTIVENGIEADEDVDGLEMERLDVSIDGNDVDEEEENLAEGPEGDEWIHPLEDW